MGQRGPKPGTGGRPKKAIADKITDGNPGRRPLTVMGSQKEYRTIGIYACMSHALVLVCVHRLSTGYPWP